MPLPTLRTNCNAKSRLGLYIMVIIAMLNSCDANTKLDRMKSKMEEIQAAISTLNNNVITVNDNVLKSN